MEHKIMLVLHVGLINIELWGDGILPILDNSVVPIDLEVVPKPVIMNLRGPIIRILIFIYHGLIFSSYEVCRSARVSLIHSP
jgi:hypothetical protein